MMNSLHLSRIRLYGLLSQSISLIDPKISFRVHYGAYTKVAVENRQAIWSVDIHLNCLDVAFI